MDITTMEASLDLLQAVRASRTLDQRQNEDVWAIANYSFDDVRERLVNEQVIPLEQVDAAILEYRKFLLCIYLGQGSVGMVSKIVDEVWHAFILFTREYTQFTMKVFGRYLHHAPVTSKAAGSPDSVPNFISAYQSLFGAIPPIWGNSAECSGTTNCQEKDCWGAACEDPTAFKDVVGGLACVVNCEGPQCGTPDGRPPTIHELSCVLPPGNCENVCDSD